MRVPSIEWLMRYMRAGGLVAAGMIIGSALFMALYQHNFSLLYMEKEQLKAANDELIKQLEPLRLHENQSSAIRQIAIQLLTPPGAEPPDEVTAMQLKRMLAADLDLLRGRSSESAADALLIAKRIISRKIYTIEKDREYRFDIQLVIMKSGVLTIWAEARAHIRAD